MSLRYASRLAVQGGARAVQSAKDHAVKPIKDSAVASGSNGNPASKKIRRFTSSVDAARKEAKEQLGKKDESLRMVMYLSCWGPN